MIEPDTKDWTWVLERPCPDCGFVAAEVDRSAVGTALRDDAAGWTAILALPDVRDRPDPSTWSPLEYACHVRDVHAVMGERLALMLAHDDPDFDNWDQDATAIESRYPEQPPIEVSAQLSRAAHEVAARYDELARADEATWGRVGRRSNGSRFTVDTLARYHLHDVVHHAHDVRRAAERATVAAYDADAPEFAAATAGVLSRMRPHLESFAGSLGPGGEVLEIGSGGGRDASALEVLGLRVRCTDVSSGFVAHLRAGGRDADVLDPLRDDLGGPYAGVWASAALLHVARADLAVVLRRLAAAVTEGGLLAMSLKEGDGEGWSTHGSVTAPRRFVYWREGPLRETLAGAGWQVRSVGRVVAAPGDGQPWLLVQAGRR